MRFKFFTTTTKVSQRLSWIFSQKLVWLKSVSWHNVSPSPSFHPTILSLTLLLSLRSTFPDVVPKSVSGTICANPFRLFLPPSYSHSSSCSPPPPSHFLPFFNQQNVAPVQQLEYRKEFFVRFARENKFDPLNAKRWYAIPRARIHGATVIPPLPSPRPPFLPSHPSFFIPFFSSLNFEFPNKFFVRFVREQIRSTQCEKLVFYLLGRHILRKISVP